MLPQTLFFFIPTPTPRTRLAHQKEALLCPKRDGLSNRAGPCQNRAPGATPPKPKSVDFGRYLAGKPGGWAGILEMAVGQPFQRQFPALRVEKGGNSRARDDGADRRHRHAGLPRRLDESLETIFRDRAEDFVIVAAGDQLLDG